MESQVVNRLPRLFPLVNLTCISLFGTPALIAVFKMFLSSLLGVCTLFSLGLGFSILDVKDYNEHDQVHCSTLSE